MEFNKQLTTMTVDKLKSTVSELEHHDEKIASSVGKQIIENLEFSMEILEKQKARAIYKLWKNAFEEAIDFLQPVQ